MTITRKEHARGHSYYIDGEKVPGVTTLLGDGVPKPALVGWAANTTAGYAVDHWDDLGALPPSKRLETLKKARYADLDAASRRGTEVHSWAERVVHGEDVGDLVPEPLRGHVESYVRFLDEWDVQPVLVETVVGHRTYRYCGTVDLVADTKRGRALLDIKTSRSGIFGETACQVSAYAHAEVWIDADGAEHPVTDLGIEWLGAVHVRADGYDVRPVRDPDAAFAFFRHGAWLARRMPDLREWIGDAIDPTRQEISA